MIVRTSLVSAFGRLTFPVIQTGGELAVDRSGLVVVSDAAGSFLVEDCKGVVAAWPAAGKADAFSV